MKTLIKAQSSSNIVCFDRSILKVQEKQANSKIGSNLKFYQKLFVILLTCCTFLIFPESPKDSDILCKKYYSEEACMVW
tara:strand:- start:370 stop:606 length:237 start_codon:yes stop_codon:yes gene_type:complete